MSKCGVIISGPYFSVFGILYTGKYGPEITPYLDTFHAVEIFFQLYHVTENLKTTLDPFARCSNKSGAKEDFS